MFAISSLPLSLYESTHAVLVSGYEVGTMGGSERVDNASVVYGKYRMIAGVGIAFATNSPSLCTCQLLFTAVLSLCC